MSNRLQQVAELYGNALRSGDTPRAARAAVASKLGLEADSVRRYLARMGVAADSGVTIEDMPPEDIEPERLWEMQATLAQQAIERRQRQGRATIRVDSDRPIGVTLISDPHIGAEATDYARMQADAELVSATPRLYTILGGDTLNNFISARMTLPMMEANVNIESQWALADYYLKMFGDSILAMVSGNHEFRTKLAAGVDVMRGLTRQNRILYDPDEFNIRLMLGGQEYRWKIRHRPGPWNSGMNLTHANKQLLRFGDDPNPPHIVSIAHHHQPAIEYAYWQGELRVHIRTGSYKISEDWERSKGFTGSGYMVPTVILWPDRFEMMAIPTLEAAADFLNSFGDA